MRLSEERIKAKILDPDRVLRTAAVNYFAKVESSDWELMPLVIRAFEQFGAEAFETTADFRTFGQTDESVEWLCRQIAAADPNVDEEHLDRFQRFVITLCHADPALLERHSATLRGLPHLDDKARRTFSRRIELAALGPRELWRQLVDFCARQDRNDESGYEEYEQGCWFVDALAHYPAEIAGDVMTTLARPNADDWLECMAVRLAGALRLESAVPILMKFVPEDDTWRSSDARESLLRIGTDAIVDSLAVMYAANHDARVEISLLLEDFHSDLAVQTALRLFEQEAETELRGFLIISVLMNFASAGIEPAREYILNAGKTPESLEVREALLLACKMLGERFPEFDAWLADSSHDREFRQEWYLQHPHLPDLDEFDPDNESVIADDFEPELGGDWEDHAPETIVRHDEKVGRNDPCPCGSGKKYKKCCLHKQASS